MRMSSRGESSHPYLRLALVHSVRWKAKLDPLPHPQPPCSRRRNPTHLPSCHLPSSLLRGSVGCTECCRSQCPAAWGLAGCEQGDAPSSGRRDVQERALQVYTTLLQEFRASVFLWDALCHSIMAHIVISIRQCKLPPLRGCILSPFP